MTCQNACCVSSDLACRAFQQTLPKHPAVTLHSFFPARFPPTSASMAALTVAAFRSTAFMAGKVQRLLEADAALRPAADTAVAWLQLATSRSALPWPTELGKQIAELIFPQAPGEALLMQRRTVFAEVVLGRVSPDDADELNDDESASDFADWYGAQEGYAWHAPGDWPLSSALLDELAEVDTDFRDLLYQARALLASIEQMEETIALARGQ